MNKRQNKRAPIGRRRNILTVPSEPGKVRRWVNDIDDRIIEMQELGYRIVEQKVPVGDKGVVNQNQAVGSGARKAVGGGVTAILMEIDEDVYKEIQAQKHAVVDEQEADLLRQVNNGSVGDYGKVSITKG